MKRHWHRGLIAVAILLVGAGLIRLRFDVDVLNLLPGELPAVRGLKWHQEYFASDRELLVTVSAESAVEAEEAAGILAGTLANAPDLVEAVVWRPPWREDPAETAGLLAWMWLNQPPARVRELAERLSPDRLPAHLNEVRERLATTFSPLELTRLGYDPLELANLPSTSNASPWADDGAEGRPFVSPDGRFRVLFVRPAGELGGFRPSARWVEGIRSLSRVAEGSASWPAGVRLGWSGKPAFLAEAAEGMARDLQTSVLGTLGLIALLFWLVHRRWGPLFWLVVALQAVLLITAALGGLLFGTLNLVSFGFAAILLGLGADYALVLYHEAAGGGHPEAAQVRRVMARAIWGSAGTTAVAFFLLNAAGLPGLGQLGSLVAVGVLVAAWVMLYGYLPLAARRFPTTQSVLHHPNPPDRASSAPRSAPAASTRRTGPEPPRASGVRRLPILLLVVGAPILLLAFPQVDRGTRALSPRHSPAEAAAREIALRLETPADPVWLLVAGSDEAEVRARLETVAARLDSARAAGSAWTGELPLAWWPHPAWQATNLAVLTALGREIDTVRRGLDQAGFTADAMALAGEVFERWRGLEPALLPQWPPGRGSRWLTERIAARTPEGWLALGTVRSGEGGRASGLEELPGVTWCGWHLLAETLLNHVEHRVVWLVGGMLVVLLVGLRLTFGRWREVALSLGAVGFGLYLLVVGMALLGWSWNLMNLTALPLLLGAGIDYSIHVQLSLRRHGGDVRAMRRTTGRALWLCAGTTAAAFGSLAWSSNAGLASLGQVCAVGLPCQLVTKLYLLPAWRYRRDRSELDHN